MDPKSNYKSFYKREISHRHKRRKQGDHEGEIGIMQPQVQECWHLKGARSSLEPLKGAWFCQHLAVGSVKLTSDFWLSEVWENKFMLFLVTKFVVICYSSFRKLTHSSIIHFLAWLLGAGTVPGPGTRHKSL